MISAMTMKSVLRTSWLLACFAASEVARADTHIWSGAEDGLWSNAGNWSEGGAPVANEAVPVALVFPADALRLQATNDISNLLVDFISFFGDNYTLAGVGTGLALTLSGARPTFPFSYNLHSDGTNNVLDSSLGLVLTNTNSFAVSYGDDLVIQSLMSGQGGFTKYEVGILCLGGTNANTYTGTTTVADGILC